MGKRKLVGRVLLGSAVAMMLAAAAVWLGWLPISPGAAVVVATVLVIVGVTDLILALFFLGIVGPRPASNG